MTGMFSAGLKVDRLNGGNADADPEAASNAEASWVSLPDQLCPSKVMMNATPCRMISYFVILLACSCCLQSHFLACLDDLPVAHMS